MSESRVHQTVRDLAAKIIENHAETDESLGVISEKANASAYYDNLPEGLTKETDNLVDEYRTNFIAAAALATGEIGTELLRKNSNIDVVTSNFAFGKNNNAEFALDRSREYPNPKFVEGESKPTIVKNAVLTAKVHTRGTVASAGQLKHVRAEILEKASKGL